ncbi:hypothetical protein VPHF35G1_0019 [Vibrio phage F35 g1]
MIEFRYWHKDQARNKYQELRAAGRSCNMSCDGRGVIVRVEL